VTSEPSVPGPQATLHGSDASGEGAVVARGLRRSFGGVRAVDGIDLTVPAGSFFGLLGPNGAGKTTTLRMLTALLRPDAGDVWIESIHVWTNPDAAKAIIGALHEEPRLFDRLSGAELLEYHGLLRGLAPTEVRQRADDLLDVLDLRAAASELVVDYSHGMRKKIALAVALLHNPKVLFLDEPFEAIDPVSARTIRSVLQRYTSAGSTIVFSSHVLDVVERICDHVAIVHHGRIVVAGPIDEVRAGGSLEDVFVEVVGARDATGEELAWLGTSSD